MPSMSLTRADFDNLAVTATANPTPYGYHYSELACAQHIKSIY